MSLPGIDLIVSVLLNTSTIWSLHWSAQGDWRSLFWFIPCNLILDICVPYLILYS